MSVGMLVTSIVNYYSNATEFGEGEFFCKFANKIRAPGVDTDLHSSHQNMYELDILRNSIYGEIFKYLSAYVNRHIYAVSVHN
jgi:hypothetical protein